MIISCFKAHELVGRRLLRIVSAGISCRTATCIATVQQPVRAARIHYKLFETRSVCLKSVATLTYGTFPCQRIACLAAQRTRIDDARRFAHTVASQSISGLTACAVSFGTHVGTVGGTDCRDTFFQCRVVNLGSRTCRSVFFAAAARGIGYRFVTGFAGNAGAVGNAFAVFQPLAGRT